MNTKQRWVVIATAFVLGLGFFYNGIQFLNNANSEGVSEANAIADMIKSLLTFVITVLVVGVGGFVWFRKD